MSSQELTPLLSQLLKIRSSTLSVGQVNVLSYKYYILIKRASLDFSQFAGSLPVCDEDLLRGPSKGLTSALASADPRH